jgi:hypothetical protein
VVSSEPPESALVLLGEANKDIDEAGPVVRCGAGWVKVLVDNFVEESINLPKYLLTTVDKAGEMVNNMTEDIGEVVLWPFPTGSNAPVKQQDAILFSYYENLLDCLMSNLGS